MGDFFSKWEKNFEMGGVFKAGVGITTPARPTIMMGIVSPRVIR
jgi:hypothetical protein